MSFKTTAESIEEVQAAITAVLNNQSYTLDGRSVTRANLAALTARETMLLERYQKETSRTKPRISYANMSGTSGRIR